MPSSDSSEPSNFPSVPKPFSFPKFKRVRKKSDFERVYNGKSYLADQTLVVNYVANGIQPAADSQGVGVTRLGLSISRRAGNAVVRNRWKRVIREAFRRLYPELPRGFDLVIRPRQGAVCQYHRVYQSLRGIAQRLKVSKQRDRR
jgi:ribonuclease P protein component